MIPYDIKIEIKNLEKKYLGEEISELKSEIENLKQEVKNLNIELSILKEGGNI